MSADKPKYWITDVFVNRISHRTLTTFEDRNPKMFAMLRSKHDTWAEAHTSILAQRVDDVAKLKHKLKLAEAQLAKAKTMKPPKAAT